LIDKKWGILLRYSNAESSTIQEHEQIAAKAGFVWWGWWKKQFEPAADGALTRLQARVKSEPQRVGLINRKDARTIDGFELYIATCADVVFGKDGARIACPDPLAAPSYYSKETFPAWFRFTHFEPATVSEFKREFGAVPGLDSTLYEVIKTVDSTGPVDWQMLPSPSWDMKPRSTRGDSILHLSDLHFGTKHAFAGQHHPPANGPGRPSLLEKLMSVLEVRPSVSIGIVIVTGDLISRSEDGAYNEAIDFLSGLCDYLQLGRDRVVLLPGNHDISLLQDKTFTRTYEHERSFRNFVGAFYGEQDIRELDRVHRYQTPQGWDISVIALNSSRLRSLDTRDYGYVGAHRYRPLLEFVTNTLRQTQDRDPKKTLLVAAMHHHLVLIDEVVIPEQGRPVSVTIDAGEILGNFQQFGVQLLLHGHRHVPFVAYVRRSSGSSMMQLDWSGSGGGLTVVGLGTTGSDDYTAPWSINVVGLYSPSEDGLHAEILGYSPFTNNIESVTSTLLDLPVVGGLTSDE
jgi:3',5'-cyclic AMP phosphodiesterase CpdA